MGSPPSDDMDAPKGDIAPARAALLRFTEASSPVADVDAELRRIATLFNRWRRHEGEAPRYKKTAEALARVSRAAGNLASALNELDDTGRRLLLGDAQIRGLYTPDAKPKDDIDIAFASEIATMPAWSSDRDFIAPSVARAKALVSQAANVRKKIPLDKGGPQTSLILGRRSAKLAMALECIGSIHLYFGVSGLRKIKATRDDKGGANSGPLYAKFVTTVFYYAVGDKYAEGEDGFDKIIKSACRILRRRMSIFHDGNIRTS